MIAALALLAASLSAAESAGPFAAIDAAWLEKGFRARDRVGGSSGELSAFAAIYTPTEGGGDRLEVHVVARGKPYLGFVHPSTVERLELDPSPAGRFADLFGDGSLSLAYRSTRASLGAAELNVLRWKRFKIERVATFPEGRFLRLDGGAVGRSQSIGGGTSTRYRVVVAARELPLGRYLSMGCEDFGTISRTAFKTTLHAPRAGGFADASAEHPDFYASEIDRKEKALGRLKGSLEKNAGEYLGLALSSYYDYAALGRAREGWTRLRGFFSIPALAPPAVKACMAAMEKDLRDKLKVPAAWP